MRHRDAGVAHDLGECAQAHDPRAPSFRHAGGDVEPPVRETFAVFQHLARGSAEADQVTLNSLPGCGRLPAGDLRDVRGRHVCRHRLRDRIRQIARPAEEWVLVDEANVQRVDHEGEPVDPGLVRLQIPDVGPPIQGSDHVQVRILAERKPVGGPQRYQRRLDGSGRGAAEAVLARERGHQGDGNVSAPFAQVGQVFFGRPLDHDRLAGELLRSIAPDGADIACDHVGPAECCVGTLHTRITRLGRDSPERRALQLIQRRSGNRIDESFALHQGKVRQSEVNDGVGVTKRRTVPRQRLREIPVIQAGNHEDVLLGKDPGLGPVGQNDAPTLEAGPDSAPVYKRGGLGSLSQQFGAGVHSMGAVEGEDQRHAFERDGIDAAVGFGDQLSRALDIAARPTTLDLDRLGEEGHLLGFRPLTEVYDTDSFHRLRPPFKVKYCWRGMPAAAFFRTASCKKERTVLCHMWGKLSSAINRYCLSRRRGARGGGGYRLVLGRGCGRRGRIMGSASA